jgi:glycosyltransferase involved in cell wall biosynthesis
LAGRLTDFPVSTHFAQPGILFFSGARRNPNTYRTSRKRADDRGQDEPDACPIREIAVTPLSSVRPSVESSDNSHAPCDRVLYAASPHNALRSICIVTTELPYLYQNGGIGSCNWHLAGLLGKQGWRVHVLYCGEVGEAKNLKEATSRLARLNCSLHHLKACEIPPEARVASCHPAFFLDRSDWVRHALETLHRAHQFSLVEFADYQALGFRPVQAKRTGLAFGDVSMIVKLHSSSQWLREANLSWMTQVDELLLDHCERYAFENADLQIAPCQYMLDYARSIGWQIKDTARVVPYVFPEPAEASCRPSASINEIVFFGRLETRKGLELFVDAVQRLPKSLKVTLLGKDTPLPGGHSAVAFAKTQLRDRKLTVLSKFDRDQALEYLGNGTRLAVMPSLLDNSPNTVIECASHGIPFLASRTGGIPELLPDPELHGDLLFEPEARALATRLDQYLKLAPARRQALLDRAKEVMHVAANHQAVVAQYHQFLREQILPAVTADPATPPIRLAEQDPLVTVAVTYFNLPRYLPEALASLAAQTYANLEVLVVDDGSTSPVAIRVFEEQQRRYPQFRFLSQANGGLSAARNLALAEATGEFFLPVDADNVARPDMVAAFVRGLGRNPDVSAMACYHVAFATTSDLDRRKFAYAYRPTAGPHVMGSFRNVYGDANAIFRTADLRAVNGYEPDRDSTCEDWETFVKLVNAGRKLDVIPEHLFYYRHRAESLVRSTHPYRNHHRILRHFFQSDVLPKHERIGLWSALGGAHSEWSPAGTMRRKSLRYLLADRMNRTLRKLPWLHYLLRQAIVTFWINPDQEDG